MNWLQRFSQAVSSFFRPVTNVVKRDVVQPIQRTVVQPAQRNVQRNIQQAQHVLPKINFSDVSHALQQLHNVASGISTPYDQLKRTNPNLANNRIISAPAKIQQGIDQFGLNTLRSGVKIPLRFGISAAQEIGKHTGLQTPTEIRPTNSVTRTLLGNETVKGLSSYGKETPIIGNKLPGKSLPIVGALMAAADNPFTSEGGKAIGLLDNLSKTKNVAKVAEILGKQKIDKKIVDAISPIIAQTKDKGQIQNIITDAVASTKRVQPRVKAGVTEGGQYTDKALTNLKINNPLGAKTDGSLTINNPLGAKTGPEIQIPAGTTYKEGKLRVRAGVDTTTSADGINPIHNDYTGPLSQKDIPKGMRERGFVTTIVEDPSTDPKIRDNLSSIYKIRNTKKLQTKAANFVRDYPAAARTIASNVEDDRTLAIASSHWASEQARAAKLRAGGDTVGANGILDEVLTQQAKAAENLTKAGQFSQAASVYGKTTPEGILRFTQNEIAKYNKATGKNLKISPEQAANLSEQAAKIQTMADGRSKQVEIQKLLKSINDIMPPTWTQRAATLQTMAQLLNPKTLIRNIGGNTIFGAADNASQILAAPLDKAISLLRGSERTVALPSLRRQLRAGATGLKEGSSEAWQGISLGPNTQFDLNRNPVFKGKVLGSLERGMGVALQGPDRAAYKAAYEDTLQGLMKANHVTEPTQAMIEQADYTGLYRTFQDNSRAARVFTSLKKAFNHIGFEVNGHSFGLGDFLLKYPKTPANLLSRGIDYSPAGIVKGIVELAKPAFTNKPFDQAAFVNAVSRGIVGSAGLVGAGSILGKIGIITPKPEQNKDLRNVQKTAGLGGYQINTSALKRYVLSGFNANEAKLRPGDMLVSYDWAQPLAIPVSMGASIGKGQGAVEGAKKSAGAFAEGINTLVEQPLVQGMLNFSTSLKQKGFGGAFADVAAGAPSSFVPTGVSQVNQLIDNTTRNTDSSSIVGNAINQVKAKIPGLAQTLPASYDVLGQPKQRYQDNSNNLFNVLLNPAFTSKYKPSPTAETSLGLYQSTGQTKQVPNTTPSTVTINGKSRKLTGDEQGQYQQYVGQNTVKVFDQLNQDPTFNSLPDTQKVNILSNLQTDINTAAKIRLFGDVPDKISKSVQGILNNDLAGSTTSKVANQVKTNTPKTPKVKKTRVARGRKSGRKVAKAPKVKFTAVKIPKLKQFQAKKSNPRKKYALSVKAATPKRAKISFKA